MPPKAPSEKEVIGYVDSLSNWGRWGADDELGTLNLITPEKRVEAAGLVRDGTIVSCARPITTEMAPDTRYQVQRYMVDSGEGRETDSAETARIRRGASEFIGLVFHGLTITHVDSLSHYFWRSQMYNGRPSSLVTARDGANVLSIENSAGGILSRGVLLDIPLLKGKAWLDADEPVFPEDLDAAQKAACVQVGPGDILLVRTGNYRKRLEQGPVDVMVAGQTACQAACAPWFHERDLAMMGTDTSNDAQPTGYEEIHHPIHVLSLVAMGMWLIDNCNLEDLARTCREKNRWEFMLSLGPLKLRNVTGSPVNPLAVF